MIHETELKLALAAEHINQLDNLPRLQKAKQQPAIRLYNAYFDTPDLALLQAKIGLRVRHIGDRRVQTLKTASATSGGLHQRQEWEQEINGDSPDISKLPLEIIPELKSLQQVFVTDFTRRQWDIELDGAHIEMVLDQGTVSAASQQLPICEIELELKTGTVQQLYYLAQEILQFVPFKLENRSKAAFGYSLLKPLKLTYCKASPVALNIDLSAEQSFVIISRHSLELLQANYDAVLIAQNVEALHQMRVALRRLRSVFSLYSSLIELETEQWFEEEIKWLTKILGTARDLDVFALNLTHINQVYPFDYQNILLKLNAAQTQAYTQVKTALESARYTGFIIKLNLWLQSGDWRSTVNKKQIAILQQPVQSLTSQVLQKKYAKICKNGANLTQLPPAAQHQLRIMLKKLNYGCRFFAELYPQHTTKPFMSALDELQDILGVLNDIRVRHELLKKLDADIGSYNFLCGWYAHEKLSKLQELDSAWQNFLQQEVFW
jgi:triphosphatase